MQNSDNTFLLATNHQKTKRDEGLPVEKRGGSWIGHKEEIEEWFRVVKLSDNNKL